MLTITEYPAGAFVNGIPHASAIIAEQHIEPGDDSTPSKDFSLRTDYIVVNCDAYPCCLAFGKDPKAVLGAHRMSAGETRTYGVLPGTRIAAIACT